MPKVSVIIPNYNHAPYLEKRIQSILEQTYQDFEILFLDDASTDHSCDSFAPFAQHPKLRAILNATNTGSPFRQWNKGVKHTTGDYIWIAESDDYADPKFLETLVPVLEQNPEVGLVYCQSWQIDSQGNRIKTFEDWTADLDRDRWKTNFINNGRHECQTYLVRKNTIPNASAILLRRSVFEQIGYAEESLRLSGDWMTWVKVLLQSDVGFIAEPLNYFRQHQSSVRSKSWLQGLDIHEEMKVFLFIKQHVAIAPDLNSAIADRLLTEWFSRMMMMRRLTGLPRPYLIHTFQLAKQIDPLVEFRLTANLMAYLKARLKVRIHQWFGPISSESHSQ